jgi:hypothetical protein
MTAWLEGDVYVRSLRIFFAGFQCVPLSVKRTESFMRAFADNPTVLYDHGTDERVRMHKVSGVFRKLYSPLHIGFFLVCKYMMQ